MGAAAVALAVVAGPAWAEPAQQVAARILGHVAADEAPVSPWRSASPGKSVAGATFPAGRHWRLSVFVNRLAPASAADATFGFRASSTVDARLTGRLARNARIHLDLVNVLDRRFGEIDYFPGGALTQHPGEPRELRITVSRSF